MESTAVIRWLLLLLLFTSLAYSDVRPVSSINLPMMMPVKGAELMQGKVLRVGLLEENNAPWTMLVGKDLYGIDADYLAALHQLTGAQFTLRLYATQADLLRALHDGQIDFALGMIAPPLPMNTLASDSWFSSPLRIYRNQQNQRAVMFNSHNAQLAISQLTLAQLPPALAARHQWRTYGSDLQALYTLLNQQNDYVVADETSAGFLLSQLQQGQIYQIASGIDAGQLNLRAVARDPALIEWLNQSLRQLPAELMSTLQARWSSNLPRYQDTQTLMLSASEREWMTNHPIVAYAAEADNYPWSYRDSNGTARGYGIDLLNAIAQSTGLRFTPRWVSNPQQAASLLAQHQVMLQLMQPLNGETQSTSLPVWRALWGIYIRQPAGWSHWSDVTGKRIGILQDDLAQRLIPENMQVQRYVDRNSLYDALAAGQIDALVDNVLSARWRIASRNDPQIHLAFAASDIAWPIAVGIASDQPVLRSLLDRALQQIPVETQNQMRDRWSMPPQPGSVTAMRVLPVAVLVAAGVAIVILLLLLARRYWQQRRDRQQREQAERANAMKSQFLATVSHELRTPMQAILGLLELEKQQRSSENLQLLHRSAQSLMTLLNDLQDHARIENNSFTLSPRPLALAPWLAQQRHFYHPLMRPNGPRLQVEALTPLPDAVMMDADRLQQVVNNLITNAFKFTRQGLIRLTLSATDMLLLTVSDNGSGIPLEEQPKLFDPWYQAPSGKTVSVQGSGLGLFICREMVQRMGGDISLHSMPGKGTEVTITLPLIPCDRLPDSDPTALPGFPGLRVAVVDDHPTNLIVMEQQLARFAIQADCFEQGRDLLLADAQRPYDLLFIDQMMPRPDGTLLLRLLRRRQRQRGGVQLRVLCSADAQLLNVQLGEHERVLIKPVQLQDIGEVLTAFHDDPLASLDDNLWQLAQQNEKFLNRLGKTLRDTLEKDLAQLHAAHQAGDAMQLAESAHRMKGSWLLIGIEEGATLCQQLSDKAKQHQALSAEWQLLISLTDRLLLKLETYGTHALS
ncbi:transporter substrate-binding domain-containing protein [Pantoea allii]|uniref:ATP-binding protein n=1 Tax=Pantoea allii TaxID=574096 RepID=UPI0024B77BD9|nr:ATP-binding protein [Pantoea allii]MDJ0034467.1 transporter substrate-binding domain-containing protein [Pantoea allii]